MKNSIAPYQLGFSATHQEGEFNALPVQGTIPQWLRGSLIRTGSGTLEVGKNVSSLVRWTSNAS